MNKGIYRKARDIAARHLSPAGYARLARVAAAFRASSRRISAADNPYLVAYPPTYNADGFTTIHNADFLSDPRFIAAYAKGLEGIPADIAGRTEIRWRAHTCCWAATQALALSGDFVECGVWYGILSRTMVEYTRFAQLPERRFYLVDTFGDLQTAGLEHYDRDIFPVVQERFSSYPNVHLIRGRVPAALASVEATRVAYLSIDMNGIEPERAALEHFYGRMVPGGIIYLDDYGQGFEGQKAMIDGFFADKPERVLHLPSGQGLIIKV